MDIELKYLIPAKLDILEFLDILDYDIFDLVELLEDEIKEHEDELARACR